MAVAPTIYRRLLRLALAAALPLAAVIGFGLYRQFTADRAHAFAELRLLRQLNERELAEYLHHAREKLQVMAQGEAVQAGDPARVDAQFRDFIALHPQFANIALLGPDGRIRAAANLRPADPNTSLAEISHYREAIAADGFQVSRPYVRAVTKEWTCLLSYPVWDRTGRRISTLIVPLNLPRFARELVLPGGDGGYSLNVIDQAGVIVLRLPEPERYIGRTLPDFSAITAALAENRGDDIRITGIDDIDRVVTAAPVVGTPWVLTSSIEAEVIYRGARVRLWRTLGVLTLVLGIVVVLTSRHAHAIEKPIRALAAAARAQTAGRTDVLAPLDGSAEIAETALAFNTMVQALRENKAWLQSIINTIDGIVWEADATTLQFTFVSPQARRILGFPVTQWLEEPDFWINHMHPEDRTWAPARCDAAAAELRDHDFEYRMIAKDGRAVWLHDLVTIVTEPGRPPRLRGLMVDITARKRAEADREAMEKKLLETQKLESLGVLAGGIAHDFNNLLTGILGHASLARLELPVGAPTGEALAQIEKAALRAADLCKQMLAYSGKGRFVVQSLDLNELVADTLELLQVSVSKKAALRTAFTRPLPAVSADATQLRQVVMNLVINASEALGDRTGTITVGTGRLQADAGYFATTQYSVALPPGDYVYLEVTDDGCGMSRETLARIFDPFFTTKFSGRGLGLAAVHGIIRGHQGAIKVYSEPGKGTAFRILLPATPGAAETLQRPAPAPALWRGEGIVLIIDDEPAVRQVLESMLELLGFTPESAADGALGVEKFGRDPARYAAVLLDLTMPQMDGEEAFRRLRQVRPDVKVLLMSGFNKQDAVHRFIGKGLAGFLQKPFEVSTFIAELRAVLGR